MKCPTCQSEKIVKTGSIHHGKKKFWCPTCGRQFVDQPVKPPIGDDTKRLIDQWLLEKRPWAGMARVVKVSETWLQDDVNQTDASIPPQVTVTLTKKGVWPFKVTNSGRMSVTNTTNLGYGLLSTRIPAKSSVCPLAAETKTARAGDGMLFRPCIGKAQCVIRTFGPHTRWASRPNAPARGEKRPATPVLSNAWTRPCDNASLASYRVFLWRKTLRITLPVIGRISSNREPR